MRQQGIIHFESIINSSPKARIRAEGLVAANNHGLTRQRRESDCGGCQTTADVKPLSLNSQVGTGRYREIIRKCLPSYECQIARASYRTSDCYAAVAEGTDHK